jgi:hypothetical protein
MIILGRLLKRTGQFRNPVLMDGSAEGTRRCEHDCGVEVSVSVRTGLNTLVVDQFKIIAGKGLFDNRTKKYKFHGDP